MQFRTYPPRRSSEHYPWMVCAYITLAIILCALHGCATTPKGTTQTVYVAGWTLVGATNAVADLHKSGTLVGQDYENAKDSLRQIEASYRLARDSVASGNTTNATNYLYLAQQLLLQLSAYLQAHGGK